MSAYHEQKTLYKDKDCLIESLGAMGYTKVEVHEVAVPLVGYHGDLRKDKANVIVRRQYIGGASNDIGYRLNEDGTYTEIISEFDRHRHNADWLKNLKRHYTEKVDMKTAAKNGLHFLGRKVVNGKIQLQWLDNRS